MALTWISHDVIEDNAVVVQYSISELETQSQNLLNDAASYTSAAATATAASNAIDNRLVIYLATPGRPA